MFNIKSLRKPLRFGRGECSKALELTKEERVYELCEPREDGSYSDDCTYNEATQTWVKFAGYQTVPFPCRGGNIQCNANGECTLSSCRRYMNMSDGTQTIDESCFACSMDGCNACQDASIDPSKPCVKVPGRGGVFGDVTYCNARNMFCSGKTGEELKACLVENYTNIMRECVSVSNNNVCSINLDAEISGKNMCDETEVVDVDSGNIQTWTDEEKLMVEEIVIATIENNIGSGISEDLKLPVSSCVTNKIITNYSKDEFVNRENDDMINLMADECYGQYKTLQINTGNNPESSSGFMDWAKEHPVATFFIGFVFLLLICGVIYLIKKPANTQDLSEAIADLDAENTFGDNSGFSSYDADFTFFNSL